MIAGLKRYPEYRRSDLMWLAQLPGHWSQERAKRLFAKLERPVEEGAGVVTCFRDGIVTLRANRRLRGFTEAIYEFGYQGVRKGDLVVHAMDAFAGAVGVSDSDGKATPVYAVCEPKPNVNAHYYAFLIREMARSQWVLALSRGIRERSTDFRYDTLGVQYLPLPPLDEQDAIVRFLAWANGRLERALQAKRKEISLLNEQKRAIIHRAVTRGINPAVPLKSSGIPWLGDIPAHWEVRRAKQVCAAIIDCKNRTPDAIADGKFTVVRTTNVRNGQFNIAGSYSTDRQNYEIWTQRGAPRVGDVFFTREAPAGEACLVPDIPNLCMGQRMMYFRPNAAVLDPDFLLVSIYGPVVKTYIQHACNGSTVGHLRLGQVSALPLLWCPVEEQKRIVAYIRDKSAPMNRVISRLEREISLLREYRIRLTADVVTGKLDVRDVATRLPDEAPPMPGMLGETDALDEVESAEEELVV